MTGRRAVPGHDDPSPGTAEAADGAARGAVRPSRGGPDGTARTDGAAPGGAVAPQPRLVPGPDDSPIEVEPTTGAPVDAVPRRVPVRQPSRAPGPDPSDDGLFWAPIEQVHWDGTPLRQEPRRGERGPAAAPARRTPRTVHPPDPVRGLAVLVAFSLLAAFFAWVSASPFWLAVGHATTGTVTISDCTGGGITQRCRGNFTSTDGRFLAHGVRVSGVPGERRSTGAALPARMTGPHAGTAYADTGPGRHLRWLLGLLLVAGCGAGIARWTGAGRLADDRHRRWAVVGAYAGPALITLGFLAAAW